MKKEKRMITPALIEGYAAYLLEQERSPATIRKYVHDLEELSRAMGTTQLTKAALIQWKEELIAAFAPATVNTILTAVNGFFRFLGWKELVLKLLKVQKALFLDESRELTRAEYVRLVQTAQRMGDQRLALLLQTICSTGIRVSELRFITVEAVQRGRAEISNKGKRRTVFLPERLRKMLKQFARKQKNTAGAVFVTRSGKPMNRSNIWREMKALCAESGVEPGKVFPHNLRHLFARSFYARERDLSRLADILGHSSINTTRVYTAESGTMHARQMERLGLLVT